MVDMSRYNKLRINPDRYNYDLVTNLPLRRTFWRIADKTVLFDNKTYCILAIDIENFHLINKWYGRETGDELLIEIGETLKSIDAGYGTISGYMGGDNFCVIFEENDDVINLIRKRISGIVNGYRGHDITRAYYGAYKTADKDITTGEMCDYAYGALEIAKQRPDKDIFWYDESMAREQEAEAKLMPEICSAMDNGEFTFYLQPKCILQTGKIIGSEALVRWISPEKGFISPGQFIPLLEKNGFINKLDVYIWDKVCQTIRRWLDEGRTVLPISINVSRADIYSMDVVSILKDMIEKYNISTENIEIEITESAYVENGSVIKDTEKAFKNAGFKILIDDFGSGYSSLNMLKDIDADVLKLDMKFLDLNPENNDKGVSIITAVLDMARQLDIPAIAEGIETDEQLKLLELLGCEYAQGYYYYRPMPISDYEKLVDDKNNVEDKLIILKTRKNDKSYLKEITDYFWKIADVDLDTGAYHFIRRTDEPDYVMTPRPKTIAEYAGRYIKYGVIHPDDVSLYKEAINLDRIKKQLDKGKERGRYQIRYNMDGTYKWYKIDYNGTTRYLAQNKEETYLSVKSQINIRTYYKTDNKYFYHTYRTYGTSTITINLSYYSAVKNILEKNQKYYSFDGNYFYKTIYDLLEDYRNNNNEKAINKNKPYFSYYQYLPMHSITGYTADDFNRIVASNGYTRLPDPNVKYVDDNGNFKKYEYVTGWQNAIKILENTLKKLTK